MVATEFHSTSASGSITDSMMSLTVAVGLNCGCSSRVLQPPARARAPRTTAILNGDMAGRHDTATWAIQSTVQSRQSTVEGRALPRFVNDWERRWSKQWRRRDSDSGQNTRAGHLREDQTWSERHGTEQQMPATCFAATPILFAEPVLPDDDAPGSSRFQVPGSVPGSGSAFAITVRLKADTTETRNIEVRQRPEAPVEQTMEAA